MQNHKHFVILLLESVKCIDLCALETPVFILESQVILCDTYIQTTTTWLAAGMYICMWAVINS